MGKESLEKKTILHNKYEIVKVIGSGGFGITYLSRDILLNQIIVIKEYFPWTLVTRDSEAGERSPAFLDEKNAKKLYLKGKKDFLAEARRMSELFEVQSIVKILDYFEENSTAYLVMEYVRGINLEEYLESREIPLDFQQAWEMMEPVVEALDKIHRKGIIHRDFNPSNLIMTEDGTLKIIDFGAARKYLDNEKTMTILVKRGYAPPEQYSKKEKQGPWTDVYSVCATLYEMITGVHPEPSINRLVKDELYLPSSYGTMITPEEESVLTKGLEPDCRCRIRDMRELRKLMGGEKEAKTTVKPKRGWILVSVAVIVVAAFMGVKLWQSKIGENEQAISFAGNYGRNTAEYKEFIKFTKEHAISQEVQQAESDGGIERKGAVLYTLPAAAVKEWGEPCNEYRFFIKRKELLKSLKKSGYVLEKQNEKEKNTVEVRKYGAVLTSYTKVYSYKIKEKMWVRIGCDSVNQDVMYIALFTEDGKEEELPDPAADILEAVCSRTEESRETIIRSFQKNNVAYESKLLEQEEWVYSYQTDECLVIWKGLDNGGYGYYFKPVQEGYGEYYWP